VTGHLKAQLLRFVRTSGLAFAASLLATGGHVSWSSLWVLLVGAGETGLRELMPVAPLPTVTAVPVSPVAERQPPGPPA